VISTSATESVVAQLRDGMTIGIAGWGSRRKPMSIVRAILRSDLKDLTIVAYGGPDVGMLCAAGKVRKAVYGFVSLDSIPLEPHFRAARQNGTIEAMELDEGMLQWGLRAAAMRVDFLPCRAGLGSAITEINPGLAKVRSPYGEDEYLAMPALTLDVALLHANRADARGNAQYLGPDWYFDDLFAMAAEKIVYSRTLQTVSSARTRLERDFDPDAIRRLKESSRSAIAIGGAELAGQAIADGLVDECHLLLVPIVIGAGKRALPGHVRVGLELMDERRFRSGVVHLHYLVGRAQSH
jgi:glutaconate CoA-transferase subunit A